MRRSRFFKYDSTNRAGRTFATLRGAEALEQRQLLAAFIWNTDSDGLWSDSSNWSGGVGVPGNGDTVTIDRGAANPVISIDSAVQIDSLMSSESILMQADFQINQDAVLSGGEFRWQSGWLRAGSLTTQDNATVIVETDANKRFSGDWINSGVVDQQQPFGSPSRETTFDNRSDGVWNLHRDFNLLGGVGVVFTNEGTFRKTGPEDASFKGSPDRFDHVAGSRIEVQGGTLSLPISGTTSSPSTGAAFEVVDGASLDFTSGSSFYVGNYSGTGTGRIELSQGRIDARGTTGTDGAVFDFAEGLFHWTGGTIFTDNSGGDSFVNVGHMTWSGPGQRSLLGQEFHNQGEILITGSGDTLFNSGGVGTWLHNEPGGIIETASSTAIIGGRTFNNSIIRSRSGDVVWDSLFIAGVGSKLEVDGGRFLLKSGGEFSTSTMNVSAGGVIEFNGTVGNSDIDLLAGATLTGTGAGRIEFTGGRIESVGSDAVIDFADGLLHWTGGTFLRDITSTGQVTIGGTGTKQILHGFTNTGTIIHTAGTTVLSSSSGFINSAGAIYELQGDATVAGIAFITATLRNAGTLRKTGEGTARIEGSGVALVHLGGTVEVASGNLIANHSSSFTSTGAQFDVATGSTLQLIGTFVSSGRYTGTGDGVVKSAARIRGDGRDLTFDFPEGFFEVTAPGTVIHAGFITNNGFITLNSSDGLINARTTLVNNGTIIQSSGTDVDLRNGSDTINNGDWFLQGEASIDLQQFDGLFAVFNNFGSFVKAAGGTSAITISGGANPFFSNPGLVRVDDGTLTFPSRGVRQFDATSQTLHAGTWQVGTSSTLRFLNDEGNDRSIQTNYADVRLVGQGASFPSLLSLTVNGGRFVLDNDGSFSSNGDFTNGVARSFVRLEEVGFTNSIRTVGIAVDLMSGDVVTHSRNERVAGEPIFRRFGANFLETAPPIVQPGGAVNVSGIDILTQPMNVGGTTVPAGSMLFVHANATPATLYAIDPNSGEVLATALIAGVGINQVGVAEHPTRGTVYLLGSDTMIHEINPATGAVLGTFSANTSGQSGFSFNQGGIDVIAATGQLLIVGTGSRVRVLTATGVYLTDIDLRYTGVEPFTLSDISHNDLTGDTWVSTEVGNLFRFSPLITDQVAELKLGAGVDLTVNGDFDNSLGRVIMEINGRPDSEEFASIDIAGAAILGGRIEVILTPGFVGTEGDTYPVVTFDDPEAGQFDRVSLPFTLDSGYSTTEFVVSVGDLQSVDLVATRIEGPAMATSGEFVTLRWTVTNQGNLDAVGPWHDELYLTRRSQFPLTSFPFDEDDELVFAEDSRLISEVIVGEGLVLGPGQSATFERQVRVPGRELGEYFWRLRTNSRAEIREITNLPGNNFAISEKPVQLTVPTLIVGEPFVESQFDPGVSEAWYRFDVPASQDVLIELDAQNDDVATELMLGKGFLPNRFEFTVRQSQVNASDTSVAAIADAQVVTWFVLVRRTSTVATSEPFRIRAAALAATVNSVSPSTIGKASSATLRINGTQLHGGLAYRLVSEDGLSSAVASQINRSDASEAFANFDTSTLPVGVFDLEVLDGDTVVTALAGAVMVEDASPGEIRIGLTVPSIVRGGRTSTIQVHFQNTGNTDLRLPFTTITAEAGQLRVRRTGTYAADSLTFIPPSIAPGLTVLPAGQRTTMTLYFDSPVTTALIDIRVHANSVDDPGFGAQAIDWERIATSLRPAGSDDAAWAAFIERNRTRYGDTYGELFDFISSEYEDLAEKGYENIFFYEGLMNFERPAVISDRSVVRGVPIDPDSSAGEIAAAASFRFFVGEGESVGPDGIPNVHAVIVGGGGNLDGAVSDAEAVSDFLTKGVNLPDGSSVTTLLDQGRSGVDPATVVTGDEVLDAIRDAVGRLDDDDVLLVYNASHGVCRMTDFGDPKFAYGAPVSEGSFSVPSFLTPRQINSVIANAPGTSVFIADTCYSGLVTEQINADIKIASADLTQVHDSMSYGTFLLAELQNNPAKFDIIDASVKAAPKYFENNLTSSTGVERTATETISRAIRGDSMGVISFDRNDFVAASTAYFRDPSLPTDVLEARLQQKKDSRFVVPARPVFDRGGLNNFEIPVQNAKSSSGGTTEQIDEENTRSPVRTRNDIDVRQSFDPNEKIGPAGFGEAGFIIGDTPLPFTILFENDPVRATLPAQTVTITETLDDDLDLSTFTLGSMQVGHVFVAVPEGLYAYETTVSLLSSDIELLVRITAELDFVTRVIRWEFTSIDPLTGQPTEDALAGFLLVNDETRRGEGSVSYTVSAKTDLASGTEISGPAEIVFDVNEPLITNSTLNTIDITPPTSSVAPLPATSRRVFDVFWSGNDAGGSGIASFEIYVSLNGAEFDLWHASTTPGSRAFVGQVGSNYSFQSFAVDEVGNRQMQPQSTIATTLVTLGPWTNPRDVYDVNDRNGVTPLDALLIINEIARRRVSDARGLLVSIPPDGFAPPFYDVNSDGFVTPLDALRVINQISRRNSNPGSGEQVFDDFTNHPAAFLAMVNWSTKTLTTNESERRGDDFDAPIAVARNADKVSDFSQSNARLLDSTVEDISTDVHEQWSVDSAPGELAFLKLELDMFRLIR